MKVVETMTEGSVSPAGAVPAQSAEHDPDDADWRVAAYEQFLRDDSPEDAAYEMLAGNAD